jgi:hypothetical protein
LPTRPSLFAWAAGFLLPLVTGALSQLLPVWRWPGPVIPARGIMRQKTGGHRWTAWRLVPGSRTGSSLGWDRLGSGLLLAGLALFVLGLAQAVRVQRSTR